ncbi:hypothetical protein RB195_015688 [Necator americanus]|uniref:PH domain-containing protein n=1 Tax=Necator americanus TaxID=51031 RepID=A0ABR1E5S1_NECAM
MARGRKGRGGRRSGPNDDFGDNGSESSFSNSFHSGERSNRSSRGRGGHRGGYGSSGSSGNSGGRDHSDSNRRITPNGGGGGCHERRRSSGYMGFSTGSFGVMGDADSINMSDTQSSEAPAAEVPLASIEDLRYEAKDMVKDQELHGLDDIVDCPLSGTLESGMGVPIVQEPATGMRGSSTFPSSAISDETIQQAYEVVALDGGCSSTQINGSQNLHPEQKCTKTDAACFGGGDDYGMRARSISCQAMNPTQASSKMVDRRYLSSVVIDGGLRQTLTCNKPQSRHLMHTSFVNMVEDAANYGTTVEQIVATPPSDANLKKATGCGAQDGHHSVLSEINVSEAGMIRYRSDTSQRRVRSISQTILDSGRDGKSSSFANEEIVRSQRALTRTLEEENDRFVRDDGTQIRTVQNDDHFNNHRLSKLSIHTNNDEFVYVGGLPPSDGRTSLRSRGSISRQSIHSADFLPGFSANSVSTEKLQTAASGKPLKSNQIEDDEVFTAEEDVVYEDATQSEFHLKQRDVPTIQINGRTLSESNMTSSDYVTAQDRLISSGGGGEVFDTLLPARNECSREAHPSAYYVAEEEAPLQMHSSRSSLHPSDTNLRTAESSSWQNLHSCAYNIAQEKSSLQTHMSHSSLHPSDTNLRTAESSSRQNRSSAYNIEQEGSPQQTHLSHTSLHPSDTNLRTTESSSRQNIRPSAYYVAEGEAAPQEYSSHSSLHPSDTNLCTAESSSRQDIHSSACNVAQQDAALQVHLSHGSLQPSNTNPLRLAESSSRQNIRSSACNIEHEESPLRLSHSSLHPSTTSLPRSAESSSRQNLHSCAYNIAHEESPLQTHLSRNNLHPSNTNLLRTTESSSRQNTRSSAYNIEQEESPLRLSHSSLHPSSINLRTTESSSRQDTHSSTYDIPQEESLLQTLWSRSNLHPTNTNLVHAAESSSQEDIHSSACNVGQEEPPLQVRLSHTSLHPSNTNLFRTAESSSRQNLHSSACNVAQEEPPLQMHLSHTSLHPSNTNLLRTAESSSRQNLCSSACSVAQEEPPLQVRLSHTSLHPSNTNLLRTAESSSRQNFHSSACNVAQEEPQEPPLQMHLSHTSLHPSNTNLLRTAESSSRQNLHSSACNVAQEEAQEPPLQVRLSHTSLHPSNTNLLRTAESSSRQNLCSSACSVAQEEPPLQMHLSHTSLHPSNTNLLHTAESSSRQNFHSSACNVAQEEPQEPPLQVRLSHTSLHPSNTNLLRTAESSSRQNLHSSACNVAQGRSPPLQVRLSHTSLHPSNSTNLLRTAESSSRQNLHSSACNVAQEEPPLQMHLSHTSLHPSNTNLLRTAESSSRQNLHSSACNVAQEEPPLQMHLSHTSLHPSNTNLLRTAESSSRQNLHSSACNVAQEEPQEPPLQVRLSHTSLHPSNTNLLRTAESSSRQNLHSSACNVAQEEPPLQMHLSHTSLHPSNTNLLHTAESSSRQNLHSSACNVAQEEKEPPLQVRLSHTSLHPSNTNLLHTAESSSRQNLRSSACSVAQEEPPLQMHLSHTSLHPSNTNLLHTAESSSRQNLHSSACNVAQEEPPLQVHLSHSNLRATGALYDREVELGPRKESVVKSAIDVRAFECGKAAIPTIASIEKPPIRISMVSSSPLSRTTSHHSVRSDVNNNTTDIMQTTQCPSSQEIYNERSENPPPKPAVRRSLQAIPTAISSSLSQNSVSGADESSRNGIHVFKTSGGGLWYHFSDIDRNRSRSISNTPQRRVSGSASMSRSETVTQIPPKKPPRSRSSSAASRNEVHFSSIPQLHSHPDDRFGVEESGEPFRSTSEHELTPHAQKSGSRVNIAATVEDRTKEPHKTVFDLNTGMLTVPVQEKANSEISSNEMEPPSQPPSLKNMDDVPSPLVVTDALTPRRPLHELNVEVDYNSPSSFNRTLFTREAFLRRRRNGREPERAEVAIQTGETIRLRQGMFFEQEFPERGDEIIKKDRAGQSMKQSVYVNSNYDRPVDNSFEKRGHPAASVLNSMLQQRQMQPEQNRQENRQTSETTSKLNHGEITERRDDLYRPMTEASERRSETRRSFIDNQHHQYETRTHQEWRSSTRSQWEEGKLDENFNEVLRGTWNQSEEQFRPKDTNYSQQQQKTCNETSDQSYAAVQMRERIVDGKRPTSETFTKGLARESSHVNHDTVENPPQYLHEVISRRASVPSTSSNVIHKKTAEELRQKVLAESRSPSTPKSVRVFGFESNRSVPCDTERLSTSGLTTRNTVTTNDASLCAPPTRISLNNPNTLSLYSPTSSRWHRRVHSSDRSEPTSPYKWQVPDIDTRREYREPDARSNESKISGTGSTVRRHVPRGRIRDLARLFDKLTKQAERESAVLRGKSLPAPKQRSKFVRTRSMPRPHDVFAREEEEQNRGNHVKELPISLKSTMNDGVDDLRTFSCGQQPTDRNSGGDGPELATQIYGKGWSRMHCTGLEPGMLQPHTDENASTDSRIDLRRTSTPLGNGGEGDLANAFGRVPSINSPENSAVFERKRTESDSIGNVNDVCTEGHRKSQALDPSHQAPSEHVYAKPMIARPTLPPQRMSVIHPNISQHGYYVQHRRSYGEKQPRDTDQPDGEPIYARVHRVSATHNRPQFGGQDFYTEPSSISVNRQSRPTNTEEEKVNGEIDRMFQFVEEHDGLSTLGRGTASESTSAMIRPDGYGTIRGEGVELSELPLHPPLPAAPLHRVETVSSQRTIQPLKYSVSGYRDMQRAHRFGYVPSDAPPKFSPLIAPTPGVGVSTYKSREGTIGEKVNTYSNFSRNTTQHPSALATSTPVESPAGTGFSQGTQGVPNFDDSFISAITTGSHPRDAHEEYKRQMTKLNHQIRVQEEQIEMTLKVLALARKKQKSMQELSAQRTLLLARERLDLLRCEVSRISALAAVRNPPPPVSKELRGTMTISNICIYLNRSFCQRQYEQESSYALLILLKCGAEVEATGPVSLLAHNQNRIRQLTFAENVQFSNLPVDFNVLLEVYAMKLPSVKNVEQSCASNIANKCKNLLSPALAHRSNRASYQESGGSEFIRCGYIILNRDTVGMNKFYLDEAEYPLEGTIEVFARCTTLPPAIEVDNRGFLTMYQTVSGMGSWERYWAVLRRGMVYFWRYPDDESNEKRPVAFMDLSKCTNDLVVRCTPEQCPRENSFSIDMLVCTTPSLMEKKRVLLSADSEELLHAWLQALNETLSVLRG